MYARAVKWPENKQCASLITVNLSSEFFWLSLDKDVVNMPKTLSMGQYGMNIGLYRVLDAFDKYGTKATFFVPGKIAEIYRAQVEEIAARGHEIACMGYTNENYGLIDVGEQKNNIKAAVKSIENCCGIKPKGFRTPNGEITKATLKLLSEEGFSYSSDLYDDDRPYWMDMPGGKRLLQIPIHWPLYDLPYFAFNYKPAFPAGQGRIANYGGVLNNWTDEFDGYYYYGLCYVLQLEPQSIGNPGRIGILDDLLRHIRGHENVWHATCGDVLNYFERREED